MTGSRDKKEKTAYLVKNNGPTSLFFFFSWANITNPGASPIIKTTPLSFTHRSQSRSRLFLTFHARTTHIILGLPLSGILFSSFFCGLFCRFCDKVSALLFHPGCIFISPRALFSTAQQNFESICCAFVSSSPPLLLFGFSLEKIHYRTASLVSPSSSSTLLPHLPRPTTHPPPPPPGSSQNNNNNIPKLVGQGIFLLSLPLSTINRPFFKPSKTNIIDTYSYTHTLASSLFAKRHYSILSIASFSHRTPSIWFTFVLVNCAEDQIESHQQWLLPPATPKTWARSLNTSLVSFLRWLTSAFLSSWGRNVHAAATLLC